MNVLVPALSELRHRQDRGEATPISDRDIAALTHPEESQLNPLPHVQFVHVCGKVGRDGFVSSLAMNHFVELVIATTREAISYFESASVAEFLLAVAIAPGGRKRIEMDCYPKSQEPLQHDCFLQKISAIDIPVVEGGPVAFGLLGVLQPQRDQHSIFLFPSLRENIMSQGVEVALAKAFGSKTAENKKTDQPDIPQPKGWWRRFHFGHKPKPPVAKPKPSVRDVYNAQQEWLEDCQRISREFSWIELKNAALNELDDARFQVALAEKHWQQSNWEMAIEWYDKVIGKASNSVTLLERRAMLHLNAGNTEAALRDYSCAVERAPEIESCRLSRALVYGGLQIWEEARKDLDEVVRLAPISPEAFFHRGQVRLYQNQYDGAADDFREAIRLDPNFGQAHFRLGWLLASTSTGEGDKAISHLTRAIELTHDNIDIQLHRSMAYSGQNKYALAIEDCDQVLTKSPDNPEALGIRGRILQCDGQYDEAIRDCTRAIELGNEHAAVYLARAISYASTDQPTLAESDCQLALAIAPESPGAIQLSGRLKLESGDLDAAIDSFNRARDLAPDWTEPREYIAVVHRMKENPKAAVEELTRLIERQPNQASHYVNRAFSLTQLREYGEASKDYDRAIALEPENEKLYFLRGNFRLTRQEAELALADFDRVLALDSGDDNARACRANALVQLRRYQDAIEDFAILVSKYPENPVAYSGRAFAYAAIGNGEQAKQDTERLAEVAPELADGAQRSTEAANLYRLVHDGDYDAALTTANAMISDWPDISVGYRLRGYVHWEREEYVEALDDYTRVLDKDGPTSDCLSSRGQVLAELGEWERALIDLNQAVNMAREAGQTIVLAYALNGRSLAHSGMGREEESVRDFEESVSLCPTNPWVYYHRGMTTFHSNRPKDARILLELALEFKDPPLSARKKQRARAVLSKVALTDVSLSE